MMGLTREEHREIMERFASIGERVEELEFLFMTMWGIRRIDPEGYGPCFCKKEIPGGHDKDCDLFNRAIRKLLVGMGTRIEKKMVGRKT